MVARICEFHAVPEANRFPVHHECGLAQDVIASNSCRFQVRWGGKLVSLRHSGQGCSAHSVFLTLGKHATTIAVFHEILDIVQGATSRSFQIARRPTQGVGCICHQIVLITVFSQARVVAVAPRVTQIQPMPHFVGQSPRPIFIGRANGTAVTVLKDNAIFVCVLVSID